MLRRLLLMAGACLISAGQAGDSSGVSIRLHAVMNRVASMHSKVAFRVEIRNDSTRKFQITKSRSVTSVFGEWTPYYWKAKIISPDSTPMFFIENHFDRAATPSRRDYAWLHPGNQEEFEFEVDFADLFSIPTKKTKENEDFGTYRIVLAYVDPFGIARHSLKGEHHSNEVLVVYER